MLLNDDLEAVKTIRPTRIQLEGAKVRTHHKQQRNNSNLSFQSIGNRSSTLAIQDTPIKPLEKSGITVPVAGLMQEETKSVYSTPFLLETSTQSPKLGIKLSHKQISIQGKSSSQTGQKRFEQHQQTSQQSQNTSSQSDLLAAKRGQLPSLIIKSSTQLEFEQNPQDMSLLQRQVRAPIHALRTSFKKYKMTGENEITDYRKFNSNIKRLPISNLILKQKSTKPTSQAPEPHHDISYAVHEEEQQSQLPVSLINSANETQNIESNQRQELLDLRRQDSEIQRQDNYSDNVGSYATIQDKTSKDGDGFFKHNYSNQLLYSQLYKKIVLPEITQPQQLSPIKKGLTKEYSQYEDIVHAQTESQEPEIVIDWKNQRRYSSLTSSVYGLNQNVVLPTNRPVRDKVRHNLRTLLRKSHDVNQDMSRTILDQPQREHLGGSDKLNLQNLKRKYQHQSATIIPKSKATLGASQQLEINEVEQLSKLLNQVIDLIYKRQETRATSKAERLKEELIQKELSAFVQTIKCEPLRRAFFHLSDNSKQIVKFLMQPQLIKMHTLGDFTNLISSVIDCGQNPYVPAEPFKIKMKVKKPAAQKLLEDIAFSQECPEDFNSVVLGVGLQETQRFFAAIKEDDIDQVKQMLAKNRLLAFEYNENLETPLHSALRQQTSLLICQILVQYGSDPDIEDLWGMSSHDIVNQMKEGSIWRQILQVNE